MQLYTTKLFLAFLFLIHLGQIFAQSQEKLFPASNDHEFDNGSQINLDTLDNADIENLKLLGHVWGFLKYYHPRIAKGDYNWDYELFRILPKVISSKSSKERDNILVRWIENLGEVEKAKKEKNSPELIIMKADLDWIRKSNFSRKLTSLLLKIKEAKRTGHHYYVGLHPSGNADLKHENPYVTLSFTDSGYKILSLYRYWNIINYYFPYKYLIGEDWNKVLVEYIPKFVNTKNKLDYTLTVLSLIATINDTHANIWGFNLELEYYKGLRFAPYKLAFIENKAVVTDYDSSRCNNCKLKIGDIIESVDGKPIHEMIKEKLPITPASNYSTKLRDIARDLFRTNNSMLTVDYLNDTEVKTEELRTFHLQEFYPHTFFEKRDTCFKMLTPEIAYIYPGTIKNEYLPNIMAKVLETKGLIIDFRCYPSANIFLTLNEYLLPEERTFAKFSSGSLTSPGQFKISKEIKAGKLNPEYYKGKVVILINEETQSSAEYTTMAFRVAPNVSVVGSTTAAADGNVSKVYLPGGIYTWFSGIGVYYPDGRETQRIGIVPDIEIRPTIEGIKKGKDEVLEKAVEIIEEE